MTKENNDNRFQLVKYQIRLFQDSIFYTYFFADTFYGTQYHFHIYSTPEALTLRNLPVPLQNQTALKDICKQIPTMNYFYDSISKYYENKDSQGSLASDNTFYYFREMKKKLTR